MNLYHGSIVEVRNPKIIVRKDRGLGTATRNPAEATIASLKIKNLYNQYCFLTKRSLAFLKFVNSFEPRD